MELKGKERKERKKRHNTENFWKIPLLIAKEEFLIFLFKSTTIKKNNNEESFKLHSYWTHFSQYIELEVFKTVGIVLPINNTVILKLRLKFRTHDPLNKGLTNLWVYLNNNEKKGPSYAKIELIKQIKWKLSKK